MKKLKKVLYVVLIVSTCLSLLTWYSPITFAINEVGQFVRYTFYFSLLIYLIKLFVEAKLWLKLFSLFFLAMLTFSVLNNPFLVIGILNSFENSYKTVSIDYRNIEYPQTRIEFQLKDVGSFGYHRRKVKIIPITPLFEWVTLINVEGIDKKEWIYVDEYINEVGFKGG